MPDRFFVSPAEPAIIKAIGTVNLRLTERNGADIVWFEPVVGGMVGVQRKTISDLLASKDDGRLQREMVQLRQCRLAFVIIEGRPRWTPDGKLITQYTTWTRQAHRSLMRSIQSQGIYVETSDDEADTIVLIQEIANYLSRVDHDSLNRRPKPVVTGWSSSLDEEGWGCHLLQSFEGIGPKQAKAIFSAFGRVPFKLDCSAEELMAVAGIGAKKAAGILRVFGETLPEKGRKTRAKVAAKVVANVAATV